MGYRGEDASRTQAERQPPWQSSSGNGSSGAGPWDDGSRGYTQGYEEQGYDAADADASAGSQGYSQEYGQQDYGPYDGYGPGAGAGSGSTGSFSSYPEPAAAGGYDQGGYDHPPAGDAYGQRADPSYGAGGYQDPGSGAYRGPAADGYQDPASGGYPTGGYPTGGYPTGGYPTGGYQGQGSGSYQVAGGYQDPGSGYQDPGTGGQRQQGGYPGQDAGNDWYGGQPAAASGASFADTGSYRLNGRVIDEYGTGPGPVMPDRDPVRGYPPASAQPPGRPPLPAPATAPPISGPPISGPPISGPPASGPRASGPQASGPQAAQRGRHSGQQGRFDDDYPAYPGQGYGQSEPAGPAARAVTGGYPALSGLEGYDDFAGQPARGYSEPGGYDAYATAAGGYAAVPAAPAGADPGGYDEYAGGDDPYDDRYGAGTDGHEPETSGRGGRPRGYGRSRPAGRGKRSLLGALAIFAVAIAGVAAYVFVIKGHSTPTNPNAAGAIPSVGSSSSSQAACAKQLGTYCHIQQRSFDPTPLTVTEVFPPEFQNTTDKISYSLAATKVDRTCGSAVIGADLTAALKKGQCTQVLRASYISSNGKIMGTIGLVNLSTTNQAHYAGKVVGQNDFIAPLDAPKGVASKMDKGTGLVEAEFKGHYLILTWSIFVNGAKPSTKAQIQDLEQFGKDLVGGTVNIPLSQRMVSGAPAVAGTA